VVGSLSTVREAGMASKARGDRGLYVTVFG